MAIVNLIKGVGKIQGPLQIDLAVPDHSGGEGRIYFSVDGKYAIKIYKRQEDKTTKRHLLQDIISLGTRLTEEERQFLCYPLTIVQDIDGTSTIGCVTECIPTPPYRKLYEVILKEKQAYEQFQSGISWGNYLQIARCIARAVSVLHGKGCAHTDIDYFNFLVHPQESGVIMLDLDGSVVPGFLPPQVWGKLGWMAPEVTTRTTPPSERSDRYSLAVLISHTLLFRNVMLPLQCYDPENPDNDEMLGWGKEAVFSEHPTDDRNRQNWLGFPMFEGGRVSFTILTPALQKLTERALIDGLHDPEKRPSAQEWVNALGWAMDELWACSQCRLHFPYPYWIRNVKRRECPFCGHRFTGPLPSVFRLYSPRNRGNYGFSGRHLVLGNGAKVFLDVVEAHRNPPMSRKNEPSVAHIEWDPQEKINRLVNDEDNIWLVRYKDSDNTEKIGRGE